jgi:hypothetical protein
MQVGIARPDRELIFDKVKINHYYITAVKIWPSRVFKRSKLDATIEHDPIEAGSGDYFGTDLAAQTAPQADLAPALMKSSLERILRPVCR